MQRVKDMMAALNAMLEADAHGDAHPAGLRRLHGASTATCSPTRPATWSELVDSLVRRMSAAQRLLNSLTDGAARASWPG